MAAPTDVRIIATQASATSTISIGACNAGDLIVLVATGTQTAIGTAGTVDEDGSVASGWTQDETVDGSGTARTRIWSKVLTSATSGVGPAVGPTGWTSNGTSRFQIFIHRHADGFDTTAANRKVGSTPHNSNVTNGSSVASLSGGTRKLVAITGVTYGTAQTGLTIGWDGAGGVEPYCDESTTSSGGVHYGTGTGSCQSDRKLYDTAETVDVTYSTGLNNTTHAIATVVYQTKPVNYTASPSESVGITDASTVGVTFVRTVNDSIGVTDSATKISVNSASQVDQIALADAVAILSAAAQESTENVGVADVMVSTLTAARAPDDQVGLIDSATYAVIYSYSISDQVGVTDAISVNSGGGGSTTSVDINDAVGVTDSETSVATLIVTLGDSIGILDTTLRLSNVASSIVENVGILDGLLAHAENSRTVSDAVDLASAVVDADTDAQTFSEQVGLTDSISWIVTSSRVIPETVGVLDAPSLQTSATRSTTDLIGILDSEDISLVSPTAYSYTLNSAIGILDARVKVMSREILDYLVLTTNHSAYRIYTHSVTDSVGLSDARNQLVHYIKALQDAAAIGSTANITHLSTIVRQIPVQKTTVSDILQSVDIADRLTQLIEIAEKIQNIELT